MIIKLHVIQGQPAGKTLAFSTGDYYFGRGTECHVRFNSDWVSRQHCHLRVAKLRATLRDLGSRNGTLVNGRLVNGEQALVPGDQIQIGPVTFSVTLEDDPQRPSSPALTLTPTDPASKSTTDSTGNFAALPKTDPEEDTSNP